MNYFRQILSCLLLVLFVVAISVAAEKPITYKKANAAIGVLPTITSPEEINSTPHPISTNKPMHKEHEPPMVPPADKLALLKTESYDPSNPRHLLDKYVDPSTKEILAAEPCRSFIGITNTGWNPPDPHVAVGPSQVVVVVNSSIAIFDKNTGAQLLQSTAGYWFRNTVPVPASSFIYDPKVIYDPVAGRFVILFLQEDDVSKAEYLVSASQSSNAMGNWYSYNLDATLNGATPTDNWSDYPGLGFDYDEAVYITTNQWQFGGDFQYVKVRILPKSQIYSGAAVTWSDLWDLKYQDNSSAFTVKPASCYSDGDGEYILSNIWFGANYTTYWKITDPLGLSGGPVITRKPQVNLVASYTATPSCVQQGGQGVGTLGAMTQDVMFRNGKVYTSFDEAFNWGSGTVAAIRVLGIDTTTSTAVVDKVFGSDGKYYYFPNIYVDPANRVFLGYNRSASNEYIGVHYVENLLVDATSKILKLGESAHSGADPVRWGDYAGIGADPVDQNLVWLCSEYSPASTGSWSTWIGEVPSKANKPTLVAPASGVKTGLPVNLSWDQFVISPYYLLQIDNDSLFSSPEVNNVLYSNTYAATGLAGRTTYYWHVRGGSSCPTNEWSTTRTFTVCTFITGDPNVSGILDISDAVFLIAYIFGSGSTPNPLLSGDVNCDNAVDVSDVVYLIAYIFGGGPAPCGPC